ncbi:unnamed protein product [Acidithrix sp. C25]|nr:unnamed protein product [Acidithrix sp. C25]
MIARLIEIDLEEIAFSGPGTYGPSITTIICGFEVEGLFDGLELGDSLFLIT